MKISFKKVLSVLLLTTLIFSLIGCSKMPKPDVSVSGFFDALKKQDVTTAAKFIKSDTKSGLNYDNVEQEKVVKEVFSKLDYQIESSDVKGDNATVKAKITSVDLVKITGKMISDLLPTFMAQALSGNQTSDEESQKLVDQYFSNSINDPKAEMTATEITINLVKSDDKKSWIIVPNDDLLNAMTGNLQKAFASLNSSK
jgi:hypothetical protein